MTDMKELEERAKATPGWTWEMAGLVGSFALINTGRHLRETFVVVKLPQRGLFVWSPTDTTLIRPDAFLERHPDARPDFTSAATKGCLLEMVQEAWDDPHLYMSTTADGFWRVNTIVIPTADPDGWYKTSKLSPEYFPEQVEALVDALESTP